MQSSPGLTAAQVLAMAAQRVVIERYQAEYLARLAIRQKGADERKAVAEAKRARRKAKRADAMCMKMRTEVYG